MLNDLAKEIYDNAIAHGFDDNTQHIRGALIEAKADNLIGAFNNMVISQRIALIHSELSEALEALRKGKFAELSKAEECAEVGGFICDECFEQYIKNTFEDEIADVIIRSLELCAMMSIDIDKHIELKMKYNANRPKKHGKLF
ncbi:MAG: hypothetical protein IJO90_05945 [Alistipes sp.]|nr:hypothetical protein [Alistipes sp.]MBQ9962894.1 hypothetical protein [Alistipes sp.]